MYLQAISQSFGFEKQDSSSAQLWQNNHSVNTQYGYPVLSLLASDMAWLSAEHSTFSVAYIDSAFSNTWEHSKSF